MTTSTKNVTIDPNGKTAQALEISTTTSELGASNYLSVVVDGKQVAVIKVQ